MEETPPRAKDIPKRIRRFAVVVVAEAPDADSLRLGLGGELSRMDSVCWLSEPCPLGPADIYEVIELRMTTDGDSAVTGPV